MIFVTVGSEKYPFDRLVKMVDELIKNKDVQEEVFMQIGTSCYEPQFAEWKRQLMFAEMKEKIEEARLVIGHAGIGTILLMNKNKKPLIVVAREKKYGEHIDNHQLEIADALTKEINIYAVNNEGELKKFLNKKKPLDCRKMSKEKIVLTNFLDVFYTEKD